ncbi:hypothetical protein C8Q70DRAFT_954411 [Cubamyces menziesii]|nr:hypothetical protein C8Q70DRAFT_954411 [Cubamyces menziesii]
MVLNTIQMLAIYPAFVIAFVIICVQWTWSYVELSLFSKSAKWLIIVWYTVICLACIGMSRCSSCALWIHRPSKSYDL